MAEDAPKYPPLRATIVDDGWPLPPSDSGALAVPQAPQAPKDTQPPNAEALSQAASLEDLSPSPAEVSSQSVPAVSSQVPVAVPQHPRPLVAAQLLKAPAAAADRGVSSLGAALTEHVLIFGRAAPMFVILGGVIAGVALLAFCFAYALGTRVVPSDPAQDSVGAGPSRADAVEVSPKRTSQSVTVAAPARGELDLLTAKPRTELSIDEALLLTQSNRIQQVLAARALTAKVAQNPDLVQDPDQLKQLKIFALDEATYEPTLRAIAGLPGAVAADLLYSVWTTSANRSSATALAELLVYSKDVLPRASPALRVALNLRRAESCEQNHAILADASAHGDRRSLHLLVLLQRKYGCGSKLKGDCYPCLRSGHELANAVKSVRARRAP